MGLCNWLGEVFVRFLISNKEMESILKINGITDEIYEIAEKSRKDQKECKEKILQFEKERVKIEKEIKILYINNIKNWEEGTTFEEKKKFFIEHLKYKKWDTRNYVNLKETDGD